jgi:hypothetical protein
MPALKARAGEPQMMDPGLDVPSLLLAKSEADELLEQVFLSVPIGVSGAVFGAFASEYAKQAKPMQFDYDDLPDEITLSPPDLPLLSNGPEVTLSKPQLPKLPDLPEIPGLSKEYEEYLYLAFIPLFAAAFILLQNNFGFLGATAGTVAKASLDAWNVFANAVLKGAILKY